MIPPEVAPLLFRELEKIARHPEWACSDKVLALSALSEKLFLEATRLEQLAFSTLFARISYTAHRFSFPPGVVRLVHAFRIASRQPHAATGNEVATGLHAIAETICALTGASMPEGFQEVLSASGTPQLSLGPEIRAYRDRVRVLALADAPQQHCLVAVDEECPDREVRIRYGIADRNENFTPTILALRKAFRFPVTLNLLEVEIDQNGDYCPRVLVVEPDFLVDVSSVSECFKETGPQPYYYLVKKFLPYEVTDPMLLGNLANHFLDRLLHEPDTSFDTLIREAFRLFPLVFAHMPDAQVKEIAQSAKKHYQTLKAVVASGFAGQDIHPADSVLEPTFFSEKYGLQGRLDLFYRTKTKAAIVELKSGKPFRPNRYGIQRSHFTQTLLYDLLVRSVFGRQTHPANYILYSIDPVQPLRFAPTIAPEQWEALQLRNQLVTIEKMLTAIHPGEATIAVLEKLRPKSAQGNDFFQRDLARFEGVYQHLDSLEKLYFNAFTGFIAREHWQAKCGEEGSDNAVGQAGLWRSPLEEKDRNFCVLSHLEITDNRADQPEPVIVFRRTPKTNPLANFRVGDIAVLYPFNRADDTVLRHQVIKCTLTALNPREVRVQLRFRQSNLLPFEVNGPWNLEPDLMDTGFAQMYRGLFEWAAAPPDRRRLLLGIDPPRQPDSTAVQVPSNGRQLTAEQDAVFRKMVASKDYFLLWGPPGTGKTSVMLRALAAWTLTQTSDNLLILAYTNRAVDEICEALESLGDGIRQQYLRIGSRFSTDARFQNQLLGEVIADVQNRSELLQKLDDRRIFVGTVASFAQNDNLLRIKKIHRAVIDEASQLLEPQLVGLLSRFQHITLIGDHLQLPAVSTQQPKYTVVHNEQLQSIALTDLRDSYFERLYRRCQHENWHWAFDGLSHQGRMHADIMDFPNRHFYRDYLKTLPAPDSSVAAQWLPLNYTLPDLPAGLPTDLCRKRVLFWPTPVEDAFPGQKINRTEALRAVQLALFFKILWKINGKPCIPGHTIGIITPWRAQIAQMRAACAELGLDPDELTIDTVERYQGGARDIIIVSCCINSATQLASLVSLSADDVDRKLNVALTRAREHVVVLGNASILVHDPRYRAFIEQYSQAAMPDPAGV